MSSHLSIRVRGDNNCIHAIFTETESSSGVWRHGSVICLGIDIDSWRFSEPLEVSFLIITTLRLTTCPVLCGAMGACLAVDEAAARSRSIDRQLGREFSRERRIVKLLLLGTGQAGPV